MRTETKTVHIFTFDELSQQAKDMAIENHRYDLVGDNWWNCIYEDAESIGLRITSFGLDRNRHANGDNLLAANEIAQNIFNEHGENTDTYEYASIFMEDWQPLFDEYMELSSKDETTEKEDGRVQELEDELNKLESQFVKDLLKCYSVMLQKDYEHSMEDEAIEDYIIANDMEFTADGEDY
jgi:hypothetical protein